jgi:hypothetical protein
MSTEPPSWPVEQGSLAFALILNFIRQQLDTRKLSRADAEAILKNTCDGAGIPIAQEGSRRQLKAIFPDLNF